MDIVLMVESRVKCVRHLQKGWFESILKPVKAYSSHQSREWLFLAFESEASHAGWLSGPPPSRSPDSFLLDIWALSPSPQTFIAPCPAFSLPFWYIFLSFLAHSSCYFKNLQLPSLIFWTFFFQSILFLSLVVLSLLVLSSINVLTRYPDLEECFLCMTCFVKHEMLSNTCT